MSISVSIVEDNPLFRGSLSRLIDSSGTCSCVGLHACAEEALLEIPKTRPDVVLMDVNLPGLNGVECVRRLKPQLPDTRFIVLTVFQDAEIVFNALLAGASGYLLKQAAPEELLEGIEFVHAGGSPLNSQVARRIVQYFQQTKAKPDVKLENLSLRERQVLDLLSKGYSYQEIAREMRLSCAALKTNVSRIYKKLQVNSRIEALAFNPPPSVLADIRRL